ncbi:hypothetical protein [Chitinophaga barathri]|uniref:hypothetical protein n=1 Tax=Chitinophaga barathri TaxID=1647451 RepID=UPI000F4F632D|nr:hypothetical protein [Chitinophaga barathri]
MNPHRQQFKQTLIQQQLADLQAFQGQNSRLFLTECCNLLARYLVIYRARFKMTGYEIEEHTFSDPYGWPCFDSVYQKQHQQTR